jgi:hypothetical protein
MTEKKGFVERIFGKKDSGCCCGTKIVSKPSPDTDTQKKGESKSEEK